MENPNSSKTILFADDSMTMHHIIVPQLKKIGYNVVEVYDGEEAIQKAKEIRPDLLITDVEMPQKTGFQVCEELKSSRATQKIPILILSSLSQEENIERGFKYGANEYITKPFKIEELTQQIDLIFREMTHRREEKVLIIDDSLTVLHFLEYGLSKQGFNVVLTTDGEKALNIINTERPDLILCDIIMPNIDGFQLVRSLKQDESTRDIPIIVFTSSEQKTNQIKMKQLGIDIFLPKPFPLERLIVFMERLLAEKRGKIKLEQELIIESITSLAQALDEKDQYTQTHSKNVSKYATIIASELNLSERKISDIRLGGLLHDLGKIGIPDAVLLKPGKLNDEEYEIIKKHPTKGANILKPLRNLGNIIPMILHHHERIDGKGYPDKLKGDLIPLEARIMAVADTYDALTTDRIYRTKMTKEKAVEIIHSVGDTQLCLICVEAFIKAMDKGLV